MWHVLGAGPVGCLWAARLARASARVTLVLREARHEQLGRPASVPVKVKETYHAKGPISWKVDIPVESNALHQTKGKKIERLIVTTKAYDAKAALCEIRHRLADNAVAVLLCNGMGVREELEAEKALLGLRIVHGSSTHGTYRAETDPSRFSIVHAGFGSAWFGTHPGSSISESSLAGMVEELASSALNATSVKSDEVNRLLWKKVAVNAAINAVTALCNICNGLLGGTEEGRFLLSSICKEVAAVAKAEGVSGVSYESLVDFAIQVSKETAGNWSSMHQDLAHGRRTEVAYVNGYIATRAKAHNIPAPVNVTLNQMIRLAEKGRHIP